MKELIKTTRRELDGLARGIYTARQLKGLKFQYALVWTKDAIEADFKKARKLLKPSPAFKEYDIKRRELCIEHCIKDDDGNPVTKKVGPNEEYTFEDIDTFDKDYLIPLADKYKVAIAANKKINQEYIDSLEEEIEFEVYKITMDVVPEDINGEQLSAIKMLIKE